MHRVAGPIAVVVLLLSVVLHLRSWLIEFLDLDRTEYGEGPLLAFVMRWVRESPGPEWLTNVPLSLTVYGPAFTWVWRTLIDFLPGLDSLLLGRALAGACGLLLVVGTALAAFRTSRSSIATSLGVLVLVSWPTVHEFFAHARVDAAASVFILAAYVILGPQSGRLLAAGILIAIASFVKQTAVLQMLPLAAFALAVYGHRATAILIAGASVAGAALWLPTVAAFGGFFWSGAVLGNLQPFSVWQWQSTVYSALTSPQFVVAAIAAWLVIADRGSRWVQNRWLVGFLASTGFGLVLSFKLGSSANYFIEAVWLGAILVAQASAPYVRRHRLLAPAAATVVAALASGYQALNVYGEGPLPNRAQARTAAVRAVVVPGATVLADGRLVGHVVRAGGHVLVSDPFGFQMMALRRPDLVQRVLEGMADDTVVILDTSVEDRLARSRLTRQWPEEILEHVRRSFCLTERSAGLFVYRSLPTAACGRREGLR